jgi:NADH:ubiquinone oxidoreductase subunit F (NADH-binding)
MSGKKRYSWEQDCGNSIVIRDGRRDMAQIIAEHDIGEKHEDDASKIVDALNTADDIASGRAQIVAVGSRYNVKR